MSERTWTKEQQEVIDSRDENLLVAAAAGSGKTAVLVEHILQRIMDVSRPVDIDNIVVVTFTKAAAAEMRERILQELEKALQKDPGNKHLMRQVTLVHNAQITTIDSFCGYVVRNHFHEINMEPDYRIGDEGELKLLTQNVMDEYLTKQYELAKENPKEYAMFLPLVDAYSSTKGDGAIEDMILALYGKAQSFPWPKEWLHQSIQAYEIKDFDEFKRSPWLTSVMDKCRQVLEDARTCIDEMKAKCHLPDGPDFYLETLDADEKMLEDILAFDDGARFYEALREAKFVISKRKPAKFAGDLELFETIKKQRTDVKEMVESFSKGLCEKSLETVFVEMKKLYPYMEELVRLTEGFQDAFLEKKQKKNVLDFSDIEHFALDILKDADSKELRPAAKEFQRQFEEIIIDEYQDSNYIQEEILTSISRESIGIHNMFMVGDVKQSIYSFRQACPEIFMDKYEAYQVCENKNRAIDLHKNFRSRKEVLDATNDIFFALMHVDIGNIEYDEAAALHCGASYEERPGAFQVEILVGEEEQESKELFAEFGIEDKIDFETKMIADKIKQMKEEQLVQDKDTGKLRPMRFSDVVILMRSPNQVADQMIELLGVNGIPAYAESKTGYFDTVEIETMLHLLRVIDNPNQDIPLAAVMHSPIFGFTDEELAFLKRKDCKFYEAVMESTEEKVLAMKAFISNMRNKMLDLPIHEFIELLLEETKYLSLVSAMPYGDLRKANLEKLVDQAVKYESTSYKGVFHFVNYIEKCQKYEIDLGEAELVSGNDDAVQIMSIHKSKGLEFPVCILAGTGKGFNELDLRKPLLIHSELGLGLDIIDYEQQVKDSSMYRSMLAQQMKWDLRGEELRILYVALTRAKEKLVITGTVKKEREYLQKWEEIGRNITFYSRANAKCYLEWIVEATAKLREKYPIQIVGAKDIVLDELGYQLGAKERKEKLQQLDSLVPEEKEMELKKIMHFTYPYPRDARLKSKYSVSEIKHAHMEQTFMEEEAEQPDFLKKEVEKVVPKFISKKEISEVNPGALRGTAMHRFMECYDFCHEEIGYETQLENMQNAGKISEEEIALLSQKKIEHFLESSMAKRMMSAAKKNNLYLEKPFVMSVSPTEVSAEFSQEQEEVLVQGIIDVFFEEDGQIVLLDYKTDQVSNTGELIKRYETQLSLYSEAIERGFGLPVKEIVIYSFCLEETIVLS